MQVDAYSGHYPADDFQNFRLFEILNLNEDLKLVLGQGQNVDYRQFSPFPTMFSKSFSFTVIQGLEYVVKS